MRFSVVLLLADLTFSWLVNIIYCKTISSCLTFIFAEFMSSIQLPVNSRFYNKKNTRQVSQVNYFGSHKLIISQKMTFLVKNHVVVHQQKWFNSLIN